MTIYFYIDIAKENECYQKFRVFLKTYLRLCYKKTCPLNGYPMKN